MTIRTHCLAPLDTPKLSPGELEVLKQAHQHKSNAEIAEALGLKVKTVRMHLQNASLKYRDHQQLKSLGNMRFAPTQPKARGMVR